MTNIRNIYLDILKREPTLAECKRNKDIVREIGNLRRKLIEIELRKSKEFHSLKVVPKDIYFGKIEELYEKVLKRDVDGHGLLRYGKLLTGGYLTLNELEDELKKSRETKRRNVNKEETKEKIEYRECGKVKGKYVHVVSIYNPRDRDTKRRYEEAKENWERLYDDTFEPGYIKEDKGEIPTINEILDEAIETYELEENVKMIYTNADIHMCKDVKTEFEKLENKVYFSFRRDYEEIKSEKTRKENLNEGEYYSGCDMFIIPVWWWKEKRKEMPKMKIGRPFWDMIMRIVMEEGELAEDPNMISKKHEIAGLNYHEKHESYAEKKENYTKESGNMYNWRNGIEYLQLYHVEYWKKNKRFIVPKSLHLQV